MASGATTPRIGVLLVALGLLGGFAWLVVGYTVGVDPPHVDPADSRAAHFTELTGGAYRASCPGVLGGGDAELRGADGRRAFFPAIDAWDFPDVEAACADGEAARWAVAATLVAASVLAATGLEARHRTRVRRDELARG